MDECFSHDREREGIPCSSPSCLLRDMMDRLHCKPRLLIAIDGRCASGKTTLAEWMNMAFGWSIVHMDHFFLRPVQRTELRYAAPGENIDHERFLEEVLQPLHRGMSAVYRPYDCHTGQFAEPIQVNPGRVVIVEGSYACHPCLWDLYDLRVFLTVGGEEQLRRITARNGAQAVTAFREKWIPLEEKYFSAFDLENRCDYCFEL